MNNISGAQAIVECLILEKVPYVFGYPGGAILPFYDALHGRCDEIHHVLVRHEQGAVHAAEGYARATGRAGVCIATSGPGATNLVTGITDAMLDSVPVVCITGQVLRHLIGSDAFQETDIIGITIPITKWSYQITKASEIPAILAKAFHIAQSGRPGPVLVDITKDAQLEYCSFHAELYTFPLKLFKDYPNELLANLARAGELINQSKKPLLLVGQGVLIANAEQELKAFIEKSGIPAACTLLGQTALPAGHPLYMGMLGMHGNYAPNILTNQADLLIAIGMRFDDRVTGALNSYAKQAKIIHIDIDPSELNKNVPVDIGIVSDAKFALEKLIGLVRARQIDSWIERFEECYDIEHEKIIKQEIKPLTKLITMGEVIHQLSEQTAGEAIIVSDVGQHQMITARYYKFKHTRSHITSGGLGTMGFALPASIGVKFAARNKEVIVVVGDASFQMNIQELGVLTQEKISIKILILNNGYLGMVRQWQELFLDMRYSFTELKNPDFVKIAEGYGIESSQVSKREELAGAIRQMLDSKVSYLLEVRVENKGNVFPMVPSGASISDIRLS